MSSLDVGTSEVACISKVVELDVPASALPVASLDGHICEGSHRKDSACWTSESGRADVAGSNRALVFGVTCMSVWSSSSVSLSLATLNVGHLAAIWM